MFPGPAMVLALAISRASLMPTIDLATWPTKGWKWCKPGERLHQRKVLDRSLFNKAM